MGYKTHPLYLRVSSLFQRRRDTKKGNIFLTKQPSSSLPPGVIESGILFEQPSQTIELSAITTSPSPYSIGGQAAADLNNGNRKASQKRKIKSRDTRKNKPKPKKKRSFFSSGVLKKTADLNRRTQTNFPSYDEYPFDPYLNMSKEDKKDLPSINNAKVGTSCNTKIEKAAAKIFAKGSGISNYEIKKVLNIRVSSTQDLTPEEKIAAGDKIIRVLRTTIKSVVKGRDDLVRHAIAAEKAERAGDELAEKVHLLEEQVKQLKEDNIIWKDIARDTKRELKKLSEDTEVQKNNMSNKIWNKLKKVKK